MSEEKKGFDSQAFYSALNATREAKNMNWKEIALATSVNASTLTRMGRDNKNPDANSLAALSAWAGLNPADFVALDAKAARPEPLAIITAQLHSDPNLNQDQALALERMVTTVYKEYLKNPK